MGWLAAPAPQIYRYRSTPHTVTHLLPVELCPLPTEVEAAGTLVLKLERGGGKRCEHTGGVWKRQAC